MQKTSELLQLNLIFQFNFEVYKLDGFLFELGYFNNIKLTII